MYDQDYLRNPELYLTGGAEQGGSRVPGGRVGTRLCYVRSTRRSAALRDIHTQGGQSGFSTRFFTRRNESNPAMQHGVGTSHVCHLIFFFLGNVQPDSREPVHCP